MLRQRLAIVAAMSLAIGCSAPSATQPPDEDPGLIQRFAAAARDAADASIPVDLTDLSRMEWQKVVIFEPYADSETARRVLGFDWNLAAASPWTNAEGAVVVLVGDGRVVSWAPVPSSAVGLYCIYGREFAKADGVLKSYMIKDNETPQIYDPAEPSCRE